MTAATASDYKIGDVALNEWGLPIEIVDIGDGYYIGAGGIEWTVNGDGRLTPYHPPAASANGNGANSAAANPRFKPGDSVNVVIQGQLHNADGPATVTAVYDNGGAYGYTVRGVFPDNDGNLFERDYTTTEDSLTLDMLTAALWYARSNWHVIPLHEPLFDAGGRCSGCTCEAWQRQNGKPAYVCPTPGKHPRIRDWDNKASTDPAQVRQWWQRWPTANIGIAAGPSNLVVVDKDTYQEVAGDGILTIADSETVTSLTGGGGEHLIYRHPESGPPLRNDDKALPTWVNIRAHGGQFVAPPSLHKSGHRYEWETGYGPHEMEPSPLPDALRVLLQPGDGQADNGQRRRATPIPEQIAAGGRNNTLTSLAGSMRRRGLGVAVIEAALLQVNAEQCDPPLPDDEVKAIAASVAQYAPSPNGKAANSAGATNAQSGPATVLKSDFYIETLHGLGYSFKLNELDDTVEVNGKPISDVLRAKIFSQMADRGFKGMERVEHVYTGHAYDNRYHPIKDYLNGLKWDGRPHVTEFLEHLTFAENEKAGKKFFVRWMLGTVGKVINHDQNFMLVLDGRQDIGKSSLVRWLCPLPDYFIEGAIVPDDKDSTLRLIRHWIWEVGELQSTTRKADREALKNFITMSWATVRRPFGRHDLKKPACASMIGTVNESGSGFLDDRTGNRRFAVVNIKHIDWGYTRLDVNQIWAEIMDAYLNGERGMLSPDEKREQSLINSGYGSLSTVEEYLWEFFEVDPVNENWRPVRDILTTLEVNGLTGNQRANMMELGQILKAKETEGVTKGRPKIDGVKTTSYKGLKNAI